MGKTIQKILRKWKKEAEYAGIIQFSYGCGLITVFTYDTDRLTGPNKILFEKYKNIFQEELGEDFKSLYLFKTHYLYA